MLLWLLAAFGIDVVAVYLHRDAFGNLDGQIVLMHSIHKPSIEATKELLPWLKSKGYQLVTVSQLMQYKYKEAPLQNKYYGYTFAEVNNGGQ